MKEKSSILDRARVASPCPASWEEMKGSDRARMCDLCDLHVYNINEMTRSEAEALLAGAEGRRLCVRLYRRADGTVMTKDCPVGLRAVRVRAAKVAGTVFAALLSLCTGAFAQHPSKTGKSDSCAQQSVISREKRSQTQQDGRSKIVGTVFDPTGAVIPGVRITVKNEKTKSSSVVLSDAEGNFDEILPEAGTYTILFESAGFASHKIMKVAVQPNEDLRLNVTMLLDSKTVTVGILVSDAEPIETERGASGITVTIRPTERRLP